MMTVTEFFENNSGLYLKCVSKEGAISVYYFARKLNSPAKGTSPKIQQILHEFTFISRFENQMDKQDEGEEEGKEKIVHNYKCQCRDCQNKFGNLSLLVQVIEQEEVKRKEAGDKASSAATSSSKHATEQVAIEKEKPTEEGIPTSPKEQIESLPSTSQETEVSTKLRVKKEMRCTHCNKRFTHRGDLNKHIRSHTGEKPYPCNLCKKKFAHKSNLLRHLKVHSGDKPFLCTFCNKSFSRRDKLVLHQRSKVCKMKR